MDIFNTTKKCRTCKVEKPPLSFYIDKNSKTGLRATCKSCIREKRLHKIQEDQFLYIPENLELETPEKVIKAEKEDIIKIDNTQEKATNVDEVIEGILDENPKIQKQIEFIKEKQLKLKQEKELKAKKQEEKLKQIRAKNLIKEQIKEEKRLQKQKEKELKALEKASKKDKLDKKVKQEIKQKTEQKVQLLDNEITYGEVKFSNVLDKIGELVEEGNAVRIEGSLKLTGKPDFVEYNTRGNFYNIQQVDEYAKRISESSDTNKIIFKGKLLFSEDLNKKVKRSGAGDGTSIFYKIREFKGKYCYIPTDGNCFFKCIEFVKFSKLKLSEEDKEILIKSFREKVNEFILQNNGDGKNRFIMTNAKISKFNTFMNININYYRGVNNHCLPSDMNDFDWTLYLYKKNDKDHIGHYCLIDRCDKEAGVEEIENNFKQEWRELDEKVMDNKHYNPNLKVDALNSNVYIYDIETYPDPNNNNKMIPYAVAWVNLNKFSGFTDVFDGENNLNDEDYNTLKSYVKYKIGTDCIHEMLKDLAEVNKTNLYLIAHNGSGFDSEIILSSGYPVILKTPPILRGNTILSATISNPFVTKKWIKYNKRNNKSDKQLITLRCSFQHNRSSLSSWGKCSKLPKNIRKIDTFEISKIDSTNYKETESEWLPYLINDVLCLAGCIDRYNKEMLALANQNLQSSLSSSGLAFKSWIEYITKENIKLYSHSDMFTRSFIRRSVKGGRVSANIQKFDYLEDIIKILKEFIDKDEIEDLVEEYNKIKDKTEIHKKLKDLYNDKNWIQNTMTAVDMNSLYPSAMADKYSEYPKAESARLFIREKEEKQFIKLFNNQKFRPKTGIFSVYYSYPNDMFFTPVLATDKIKGAKLIRSRIGKCFDILTSVDIQEIVRAGGKILALYSGIVYDENFDTNKLYTKFVELLYQEKKNSKGVNSVKYALIKLILNSLYGKSVQKDILTKQHLWSYKHLMKNYTDDINKIIELGLDSNNNKIFYVEEDLKENELPKQLMPSHLGSFILSHSKRLMNDVILEIDGFKKKIIYYTDTDSLYVKKEYADILKERNYIHPTELGKLSNDIDNDAQIFYGLFLAPKVKLVYALNKFGEIVVKQTFKGFQKNQLSTYDFKKLVEEGTIKTQMNKKWGHIIGKGIYFTEEKIEKIFSCKVNLLKRKTPNDAYEMDPFEDSEDNDLYEEYLDEDLYFQDEIFDVQSCQICE